MRSSFALLFVAIVALGAAVPLSSVEAGFTDMPVYCRLLQKGLEMATLNPIIEDVNMSLTTHSRTFGDVDVSVARFEIGQFEMLDCGASLSGESGNESLFNVGVSGLTVRLNKLEWSYKQKSWPHVHDYGVATGDTRISFNVTIDTNTEQANLFKMSIGKIDVKLGAQRHRFLTAALLKLTKTFRPIVSKVVQFATEKTLGSTLAIINKKGGCAFVQDVLAAADATTLSYATDNSTVHVPVVGNVDFSVESSFVSQPTSMDCKHVGFTGGILIAHIEQVPFSTGFKWSYRKPDSKFWHNQGNGTAAVVGGTSLHIDLLNPENTFLKVMLPVLKLRLDAEAHAWMYHALTDVMVPLLRGSLQLFGGRLLTHYIKACLKDPTCPHIHSHEPPQLALSTSTSGNEDPPQLALSTSTSGNEAAVFV